MEKKYFQKPTIYVKDVNINVTNLERSMKFYKDFLGFQVLEQSEKETKVTLSADGVTPLLTLVQPENVAQKQARTTGLYHFAILLPSREDLGAFLHHAIEAGIQIGAADHFVSEAIYFSDPDGNGIEVYRDRPTTNWSWIDGKVKMTTDPLDGQGILASKRGDWNGMPKETIIGHIHLHVSELEKTEEFYVKGLGFQVVTEYPGALFLSDGDYHHHIGANVWNGIGASAPSKESVGLVHYTLAIPDKDTLLKMLNNLREVGAEITEEKEEEDSYITEDPSGNNIKLQVI